MQQFDPNIPDIITGEVKQVAIIDPEGTVPPPGKGNHVVPYDKDFQIQVDWEITGWDADLYLDGGNWDVQVFAESVGGGPEIMITEDHSVIAAKGDSSYTVTMNVAGGTLDPRDAAGHFSGIYKLVVSLFHASSVSPKHDLTGFHEGPFIQASSHT